MSGDVTSMSRLERLFQNALKTPSDDLYSHFSQLCNIIFGVALALALENLKSASGAGEPAEWLNALVLVGVQVFFGILMWMIYTRNLLLFQQTERGRGDQYMLLMTLPLLIVLFYFATTRFPAVNSIPLPWMPGYRLVQESTSGLAELLAAGALPWFALASFFASISAIGFTLVASAPEGISASIRRASWSSLFIAVVCLPGIFGALLLPSCPLLFWLGTLTTVAGCVLIVRLLSSGVDRSARVDNVQRHEDCPSAKYRRCQWYVWRLGKECCKDRCA